MGLVHGPPEHYDFDFKLGASNIDQIVGIERPRFYQFGKKEQLRQRAKNLIAGSEERPCWCNKHCILPHPPHIYFFFDRTERSINIPFAESTNAFVPVLPEQHGLSAAIRITPEKKDFHLSPESRSAYERLLALSSIGLHDLAETVGFIINESMLYDFLRAKFMSATDMTAWPIITYYHEKEKTYPATGREAFMGICTDAGREIRRMLHSLHCENVVYTSVCTEVLTIIKDKHYILLHETIALIDRKTGGWEVINPTNRQPGNNAVLDLSIFEKPYRK